MSARAPAPAGRAWGYQLAPPSRVAAAAPDELERPAPTVSHSKAVGQARPYRTLALPGARALSHLVPPSVLRSVTAIFKERSSPTASQTDRVGQLTALSAPVPLGSSSSCQARAPAARPVAPSFSADPRFSVPSAKPTLPEAFDPTA